MATDNKRFMVSVTPDIESRLDELKQRQFYNKTQSEMLRYLIDLGLKAANDKKEGNDNAKDKMI